MDEFNDMNVRRDEKEPPEPPIYPSVEREIKTGREQSESKHQEKI